MEKLLALLASLGLKLDENFNGVYELEENSCQLILDNWTDEEEQVFSIEYIDTAINETIFELTIDSNKQPLVILYAGEPIDADELEDELEERFN